MTSYGNFIQVVSKTRDGFCNLKTSVPAKCRSHTDRHNVQWILEFCWDGTLVSATPNCGSGIVYHKSVVTAIQCGFRQQFQRRDVPNPSTLLLCLSKWRQERSVKESQPQGRTFSVPAPDNVEQVRDAMLRISLRSTRRQAFALRLKTNAAFAEFSTRICITIHKKIQVAQELVNGTKWADYSFAMNSWTWWKK